jgi:tol-pal system protein YbgF
VCSKLVLILVAALLLGSVAHAQDYVTQERLDRVERDLNMLQRQVYRGAGGIPATPGDPSVAVATQIRLDRLEEQIRELTGRVEDAVNQAEQLRQRLEQINGDIEARFRGAPEPAGVNAPPPRPGTIASAAPQPPTQRNGPPPFPGGAAMAAPGTLTPPGMIVPPPPEGRGVAGPAVARPGSAPNSAAGVGPSAAASLPAGSASDQYNYAFGLLKQADYPGAEQALKAFVRQHPDDALAGNAQYWLGETYYARGRYAEAATAFAEGYKNYPKGAKAADVLLKLAMSLSRTNQKQNACVALAQLDRDFPNPGMPIKERAAAEKKRLGC